MSDTKWVDPHAMALSLRSEFQWLTRLINDCSPEDVLDRGSLEARRTVVEEQLKSVIALMPWHEKDESA